MKVVISATGRELASNMDPRFGRAKYFLAVDTQTDETSVHDNAQNLNATQGAGIQAAQNVAALGAEAVISGNIGPKAFQTLMAADIKIYLCDNVTVEEAIRRFKAGELKLVDAANVGGHWM